MRISKGFAGILLVAVVLVGSWNVQANVVERGTEPVSRAATCERKADEGIVKGLIQSIRGIIIHLFELESTQDPNQPLCGIIIH